MSGQQRAARFLATESGQIQSGGHRKLRDGTIITDIKIIQNRQQAFVSGETKNGVQFFIGVPLSVLA